MPTEFQQESLPPPPKRKGLFSPKEHAPIVDAGPTSQLNSLSARVRISEERYVELRKKMLVIEQNMLSNHKRAITELKTLNSEITEMKRTIDLIEDRIITVIKELKLSAKKEEVQVLKRYIDLWNPVQFVSVQHVEKMIDEKLKQLQTKK